jgi:hypothetical protein
VNEDEWRVEVELDDEEKGYDLAERLRSHDLDDDARRRLGRRVLVSRDGSRLFLYATSDHGAREAERVVRDLLDADRLTAEIAVTRWHPVEEAWKDVSIPLPRTEEEIEQERQRMEEGERREAAEEGSFDWFVKVHLPSRTEAAELAGQLAAEGHPVRRIWRYLEADVLTEERANELAATLRDELPSEAEIWIEANPDDLPRPVFVLLETRLRGGL